MSALHRELRLEATVHSTMIGAKRRAPYRPPQVRGSTLLSELLERSGRRIERKQYNLLSDTRSGPDVTIHYAGDLSLVERLAVSVIGSRTVSEQGRLRARRVSVELSRVGVVVTSGLAKGVDTAAHSGALEAGGRTIAVIGTPLDRSYPAENGLLQEGIYRDHLLLSQFADGSRTYPSDFPKRNRIMAALTDASVIVEASDTSGTLHQAAECVRLGRPLYIMRSVAENIALDWPKKFLAQPNVFVLASTEQILEKIKDKRCR